MRKYAVLKEPVRCNGGEIIYKIMLHTTKDGIYLYKYDAPDALECAHDDFYEDLDALHDVWDALVDDNGWIETADPAEGEQHDAFPTGHASAAQK